MGGLSPLHWMLVLLVVLLLFGTGRLSSVMGDFAKGLKAFKKNMADESDVSMEASERPAGSIAAPNLPHQTAPGYTAPSYGAPVTPPPAAQAVPPAATPVMPAPPAAAPPAAAQAQPTTVDHV